MAMTPFGVQGTLGTGSANLVTMANSTTTIVTNIILVNKTASAATASILVDGVYLVPGSSIPAYSTVTFDLKKVYANSSGSAKYVTGLAGTATAIDYHISGVTV